MCKYQYHNGIFCSEDSESGSDLCILHIDTSFDLVNSEWKRLMEMKQQAFLKKIEKGDFNFEGSKFINFTYHGEFQNIVNFYNSTFVGDANFENVVFSKDAIFRNVNFCADAIFNNSTFSSNAYFNNTTFSLDALFKNVNFVSYLHFENAVFSWYADFNKTTFFKDAHFEKVIFKFEVYFQSVIFLDDIIFANTTFLDNAFFNNTLFSKKIIQRDIEIKKGFILKNTKIINPFYDEEISRKSKKIYDEMGNPHEADYYYYREMVARRKQKKWVIRIFESPLQYIFFYGAKPEITVIYWIAYIFFFAGLYNGLSLIGYPLFYSTSFSDTLYFSLTNAITPGYGTINPYPGNGKYLIFTEAIIGTFFLTLFIAIFARKYMRG